MFDPDEPNVFYARPFQSIFIDLLQEANHPLTLRDIVAHFHQHDLACHTARWQKRVFLEQGIIKQEEINGVAHYSLAMKDIVVKPKTNEVMWRLVWSKLPSVQLEFPHLVARYCKIKESVHSISDIIRRLLIEV